MTDEAIEVVDWLSETDAEGKPESVSALGGWFGFRRSEPGGELFRERVSHRWADYLDNWEESWHPHLEALRRAIVRGGIRNGGNWHQDFGTPLFSDGTIGAFSMRAWGDLMAAVWSEEEGCDYTYCDFAWED